MTETVSTDTKNFETRAFEGTIESAYGSELATPIAFIGEYEHVLVYDAITAKELPDKDDVLTLVNNKRKANARQKAMQSALDDAGIKKPTLEDSDELKIKAIVSGLVASKKYNQENATALAKQMLGLS